MHVDLEVEEGGLESLPRFQRASAQASQLHRLGAGLAGLSLVAWGLAFFIDLFSPESVGPCGTT